MAMDHRRRASRGGWPVALPILGALMLLGGWYFSRDGGGGRATGDDPASVARTRADSARRAPPAAASDPRVTGFLSWAREAPARTGARVPDHAAQGLHRLAGAMTVIAVRDSTGGLAESGRIAALDSLADRIAAASGSRQGELTNTAFVAATAMMQEMHRRRFPNAKNDVVEARLAANAIRRAAPLAAQKQAVDQFYERAAVVVRRMSTAP